MLETSARLLRLLTALQRRRFWAGADLAEELEVTSRTLRRDVEKLRSLGYAVEATSGPGGGYRLGTGTALPPLLLDDDEAVAVAVSLRSAVDTFANLNETALAVLVKLEQLLPRRLRRRASALHNVTVSIGGRPTLDPEALTTIASACRDQLELRFRYRAREGEESLRVVEPLRLAHTGSGRWYLVAFDVEREAWRTFRVDRIAGAPTPGDRFWPREPPKDLTRYVSESISSAPYPYRARVKLRGDVESLKARVPPWVGVLEPLDDESCLLETGGTSLEALALHLLLTGVDFTLLEPEALRPKLRALGERLLRASDAEEGAERTVD